MLQGRMRKIDKRTTLPLRIPKNGWRLHERRPVLDVHDVKQQRSPFTRAKSRRANARKFGSIAARAAAIADARAHVRVMSVG
jgi:hypothetical protein